MTFFGLPGGGRGRRSGSTAERIISTLAIHGEKLDRIEEQTTKTNGKVARHDEWIQAHDHQVAVQDSVIATRKQVRAEDRAKLDALREFILDDALKLAVVALGGLVAGFLWGDTPW